MNPNKSILRSSLWLGVCLSLLGAPGCDQPAESQGHSSARVRALRDRFPEQAHIVLQQDHSFRRTDTGFALKDAGAEGTWRTAQLDLPLHGEQPLRMKTLSGLEIRVREIDMEGPGEIAENAVAYPRRDGVSYWAAVSGAYEEWLHLDARAVRSNAPVATWYVEGAEIRETEDAIELLDGSGAVQLTVTSPQAFARDSGEVRAHLVGADGKIELYVEADGEDVLVDPVWSPASAMSVQRPGLTITLLPDGRVLAAGGGYDASVSYKTAEVYNPATSTWSATSNDMTTARGYHAAVLMQNGKVLVAGGGNAVSSADIFDPATNLWSPTAPMANARVLLKAVLLGNGKVLVAGGLNTVAPKVTELYDPQSGTWSNTGSMTVSRYYHTLTLLNNGKVLATGGYSASAELYDPTTGVWTATGAMATSRTLHAATLLVDGKVLVTGGAATPHAEIYNPATGTWSSVGIGPMATVRSHHTATLLSSGRVLVAGGYGSYYLASAEQYNPVTMQFTSAGSMQSVRMDGAAARLLDGTVLVAGGYYSTTSERYLLPPGSSCASAADCQSGVCVDGVCCNTSCGNGVGTDCQACNVAGSEGICAPSSNGFVCRPASDVCDVAETCDGMATTCPADALKAAGAACRPIAAGSNCDVPEACDGASKACPADSFKSAGTLCRAAAGICDVAENCTGASAFCPQDTFVSGGTQCRAAAGICDLAESCPGNASACPPDVFVPAGTQCLNTPGLCSAAQTCPGSGPTCP